MGSACCVAARDRTITNGASSEVLQRNVRYSPSWSFRWDNRGRVAGEETSVNCFSDGISRTDGSDVKSGATVETVYASEEGSPVDSFRTLAWQKSPISERNSGILRLPSSDQSNSRNFPYRGEGINRIPQSVRSVFHETVTFSAFYFTVVYIPFVIQKPPPSSYLDSVTIAPLSSRTPATATRWSNESTGGSNLGSSDGWSIPAFSDLMATPRRERWSFDSESLGFDPEKTRSSGQLSVSPSIDVRTCGVCSKLLTEKSSWGSQKIIATNELAVVAILICGHVYHAECLEKKALRAEMDSKARNKRSRNQIVSRDLDGDSVVFDGQKSSGHGGKGLKLISSSSMKSSLGKPFLRQHFSFGSKGTRSLSVNHSTRKKGFFWSKSSKD
ncbi:RING/U-box superfamily protein [Actinidia rufa]|uniref:RING/U-box superfamily protein n=1 Tax=Actinidia rufa TaxID=165716 RepID=A0A7J0EU29_9ERIC|nr:RING/U-box superfamily protein [Actinidia rufa]